MDAKRPGDRGVPQLPDDAASGYDRPFGWWGHHWSEPEPKSLPWLIQAETISAHEAAFLSLAIEARRSIIVVAEPPKAGKTTMLTSLIDFLPPDVNRIYVRGLYERFEFVTTEDPEACYVLCNEISAHLPTYLWGRGVRLLFDALAQGFPLATTMHAASSEDTLRQLTTFPLDVAPEHVALLDLIVTVDMGYVDNDLRRRVVAIDHITNRRGKADIEPLSFRDRLRASPQIDTGRMIRVLSAWLEIDDETAGRLLATRERFLENCMRDGILGRDAVREAIESMRHQSGH